MISISLNKLDLPITFSLDDFEAISYILGKRNVIKLEDLLVKTVSYVCRKEAE